ncbi:hypothetical protein ARMSODRAFT_553386 [Armillaria solidipes]|uniref:Secreted protein n=1 Tax=Armillaria solidipes TaxID=1076256 RepID=A0A2H3BGY7_9AGAR|nr:hypothetical protein ARMSODRAFT_553386 [Armillaria solidipes]
MHAPLLFHVHAFFHLLWTIPDLARFCNIRMETSCYRYLRNVSGWHDGHASMEQTSRRKTIHRLHRLYGRSRTGDPITPLPSYLKHPGLNRPWLTIMLNLSIAAFRNIAARRGKATLVTITLFFSGAREHTGCFLGVI